MTTDAIFQFGSMLAMIGWLILLIASPFWLATDKLIMSIVITLLSLLYAWLIFGNFSFSDTKEFGSLDGVMRLFTSKPMVTAGWIHYLAFDLLVGIWIKRNSVKYGIPHLLVVPCLFFTFILGPVGLLLYLLIRSIRTKQYFADNF